MMNIRPHNVGISHHLNPISTLCGIVIYATVISHESCYIVDE